MSTVLPMFQHCNLHCVWLQSKLCMGSVFTVAVGIAGWSVGFIKDIHFRGMHMSTITMSVCLCCSCHCKICDETNQSKGFAVIAMMGGFGRLFVCVIGHFTIVYYRAHSLEDFWHVQPASIHCLTLLSSVTFLMCYHVWWVCLQILLA